VAAFSNMRPGIHYKNLKKKKKLLRESLEAINRSEKDNITICKCPEASAYLAGLRN
jgi:hypothetical protein